MSRSMCPYCVWAACGLSLMLCAPELLSTPTPLGPAPLWLSLVPFASALLRRGLRAASD